MNSKKLTVLVLLAIVAIAFVLGMNTFQRRVANSQEQKVVQNEQRLVRMHSPVLGVQSAKVTIVEFFDPACETCRAFYPIVKDLMNKHPQDIKLVIRYAPFHQGSDKVVQLLEAARLQGKFLPVLEGVLESQPMWADHGKPNVALAYKSAELAGLDLTKAIKDAESPAIAAVLKQDVEDLTALEVTKTPTFFVNGRPLPSFGVEQLNQLVAAEMAKVKP